MTSPEPAPPRARSAGRIVALGTLLGLVLIPVMAAIVMQILNYSVFSDTCWDNGAEGSLDCTLRTVLVIALSIPLGAIIGLVVSLRIAGRNGAS